MEDNYHHIEKVIQLFHQADREMDQLDDLAVRLGLNREALNHLFKRWAGVDTKTFFRFLHPKYIRSGLNRTATLFDVPGSGESSSPVVGPEEVEVKWMEAGGDSEVLEIIYSIFQTRFGEIVVGSTQDGICLILFTDGEKSPEELVKAEYPNAKIIPGEMDIHRNAARFINGATTGESKIALLLKGTEFQRKVWRMLLKVPFGEMITYGELAAKIGKPLASRAVGTAVGRNPIAYIIPCHRVIAASGMIGDYRWGSVRKTAMIGRELAGK